MKALQKFIVLVVLLATVSPATAADPFTTFIDPEIVEVANAFAAEQRANRKIVPFTAEEELRMRANGTRDALASLTSYLQNGTPMAAAIKAAQVGEPPVLAFCSEYNRNSFSGHCYQGNEVYELASTLVEAEGWGDITVWANDSDNRRYLACRIEPVGNNGVLLFKFAICDGIL